MTSFTNPSGATTIYQCISMSAHSTIHSQIKDKTTTSTIYDLVNKPCIQPYGQLEILHCKYETLQKLSGVPGEALM